MNLLCFWNWILCYYLFVAEIQNRSFKVKFYRTGNAMDKKLNLISLNWKINISNFCLWFGSIFAIQEDSEELEEPKQVVYKENDVGTTLSDGSENSNDSEESKIEGTRNNLLEKNGLYPSLNFLIFLVHLMPLKYLTMMLLSEFFLIVIKFQNSTMMKLNRKDCPPQMKHKTWNLSRKYWPPRMIHKTRKLGIKACPPRIEIRFGLILLNFFPLKTWGWMIAIFLF